MPGDESEEKLMIDHTIPSLAGVELSELHAAQIAEHSVDRAERALVGQIIDEKFKITDVLGKGGMSVVYKANWVVLKKTVAVKTMHSHLVSDTNALMRFKQEAQAAIALDHANVIKVYHFGITGGDDSKPYIVMDYIEGESLSERIKRDKRLPVKEVLQIFTQVCSALDHAHKKGVIHRDLKPSNIMLLHKSEGEVNTKLVDFGIAKLLPQEGEQAHRLTQTGDIFGSPMYMSPEQCMGRAVDKRSDVYALGCVLYESLSGMPPHMGGNVFETFHKHISEIPASLNIPGIDKYLLQRLDAIVFRALEKDPDKRYQTMADFEADVHSVLNDLQSGVRGTNLKLGIQRQQRSLLRFMQAAPKLALLAALGVIILGGIGAWGWSKSSWFYETHLFEPTETHWMDFMPDKRKKVKLSPQEKQERLSKGLMATNFALLNAGEGSVHQIEIWKEKADICAQIDAAAEEVEARRKIINLLRNGGGEKSMDYCTQAELLAECLILQGDFNMACQLLREAADIRWEQKNQSTKTYISLGYSTLMLAQTEKDPEQKKTLLSKARVPLDLAKHMLLGSDDEVPQKNTSVADFRRLAIVYALLGDLYRLQGQEMKSDEFYGHAERTLSAPGSEEFKSTGFFLKEIALARGFVNLSDGNYKEASKEYAVALAYARSHFAHDPVAMRKVLDGYAFAAWNAGNPILAIQLHDEAAK